MARGPQRPRATPCDDVPMGAGSVQLARVFGIRIGASPSWFVVLFLMIYWLSDLFDELLVGYSNTTAYLIAVADAYCAARLDGAGGLAYGTLPAGADTAAIVARHTPADL